MVKNNFESDTFSYKEEGDYHTQRNSIKELVLMHLRKISDICTREFRGGWWEKKPIQTAGGIMFSEIYHEDVREEYCNAINFLSDVLYPLSDKVLREYLDKNDIVAEDIEDIKAKVKAKRLIFQQINKMFDRTNFWQSSDTSDE